MPPSTTNHQVIFTAQGVAEVQEVEMPQAGPNDLLVRTRVSLISPGTERAFFLGLPNTPQTYPQRSGYSVVGDVVAVGANVTGFAVGEHVICAAHHAAYAAVDAQKCLIVPDGGPTPVTDEQAVFFNLCTIALQGVRKARLELGESVVVVGGGLIGLLAMQMAKLHGGLPVVTVDRDEVRLDFAQSVGADAVLYAGEKLAQEVAQLCQAEGAAVVIEATGNPDAIPTAFTLARPGGRVILLGSTRGITDGVNFYRDVHRKGLTIVGAHLHTGPRQESAPGWWTEADNWRVVMSLLAHRRLTIEPMITHRFGWQDAPHAYDLLKRWDHNALGMVLDWRS